MCIHTSYLKVDMEVSVCEQGLGKFSQESLEQRGHIIGMEVSRLQVNISPAVKELPKRLLANTVTRHPEKPLHMQI